MTALNIKKQNSADLELDIGKASFSRLNEGDYDIVLHILRLFFLARKG